VADEHRDRGGQHLECGRMTGISLHTDVNARGTAAPGPWTNAARPPSLPWPGRVGNQKRLSIARHRNSDTVLRPRGFVQNTRRDNLSSMMLLWKIFLVFTRFPSSPGAAGRRHSP